MQGGKVGGLDNMTGNFQSTMTRFRCHWTRGGVWKRRRHHRRVNGSFLIRIRDRGKIVEIHIDRRVGGEGRSMLTALGTASTRWVWSSGEWCVSSVCGHGLGWHISRTCSRTARSTKKKFIRIWRKKRRRCNIPKRVNRHFWFPSKGFNTGPELGFIESSRLARKTKEQEEKEPTRHERVPRHVQTDPKRRLEFHHVSGNHVNTFESWVGMVPWHPLGELKAEGIAECVERTGKGEEHVEASENHEAEIPADVDATAAGLENLAEFPGLFEERS